MPNKGWQLETKSLGLLSLYGLAPEPEESYDPKFGNMVKLPLRDEIGVIDDRPPTLMNLCEHFDEFDDVYRLIGMIQEDKRNSPDFEEWVREGMQAQQKEKSFGNLVVEPIRRLIEKTGSTGRERYPAYFYCLPYEAPMYSINPSTGKLEYKWASKHMVLTALPITARIAENKFKLSERELQLLAPQLLWLTAKFCERGKLKTFDEALQMLADWRDLLPGDEHRGVFNRKVKATFANQQTKTKMLLPPVGTY